MTFTRYKILVKTVHIRNYDNLNNRKNTTTMFKDFPQHDVKNDIFSSETSPRGLMSSSAI